MSEQFSHYFKDCPYDRIDVYRVLQLFNVTDPALQHAIKKLLVAGGRGSKDIGEDVGEAIVALERWAEMRREETPPALTLDAERLLYGDEEAALRHLERSDIPNASVLAANIRAAKRDQTAREIAEKVPGFDAAYLEAKMEAAQAGSPVAQGEARMEIPMQQQPIQRATLMAKEQEERYGRDYSPPREVRP